MINPISSNHRLGRMLCLAVVAALLLVLSACQAQTSEEQTQTQPPTEQQQTDANTFLENNGEDALKTIVADADYLTAFSGHSSFDSVSQLTPADLFNAYAATNAVQSKMSAATVGWVELPVSDITAFYAERFGVSFLPDDLIAQRGTEVLRYTDDSKQTLLLSTVNGGVYWPSAMPYMLTIDSSTPDGDLLTIHATRHYVDETDGIDDTYAIALTLRITDTGYRYGSYDNTLVERNGQSVESSASTDKTVS